MFVYNASFSYVTIPAAFLRLISIQSFFPFRFCDRAARGVDPSQKAI